MATAVTERPASERPVIHESELPQAKGLRLINSVKAVRDPMGYRDGLRERFGPVCKLKDAVIGDAVQISDPALVGKLFRGDAETFEIGEARDLMEPITGSQSILLLNGKRHLRMRKLLLPPFHGEAIAHYRELVEQIAEREIDTWQVGKTVRTRALAQAVTLEVIIRAVFGISNASQVAELKRLLPPLSDIHPALAFEFVRRDLGPRSPWGRFVRTRARVDEMLYAEIDARRQAADLAERDDILSLLLMARDEQGNALTDTELRDELVTILLAGHETTATSIGWAFERLLRTPHALDRLTAEVKAGESTDYLDATIKETLRIRPVVMEVARSLTAPVEIDGYRFEAGTQLIAAISVVQHSPEIYDEPQAFRPERYLEGAPEPYTWIPFGGGIRRCLGASFAQLEMQVVIGAILRRAKLRAPSQKPEKQRFRGVVLMPGRGGEAVVEGVRR